MLPTYGKTNWVWHCCLPCWLCYVKRSIVDSDVALAMGRYWTASLLELTCNYHTMPCNKRSYALPLAWTKPSRHALKLPQVRPAIEEDWTTTPPIPSWASIEEHAPLMARFSRQTWTRHCPPTCRAPVKAWVDDHALIHVVSHAELRNSFCYPHNTSTSPRARKGSGVRIFGCTCETESNVPVYTLHLGACPACVGSPCVLSLAPGMY